MKIHEELEEALLRARDSAPIRIDASELPRMADEVIRQMEWVRECCADLVGGAAEDTHEQICEMKLTAAPADFSPFPRRSVDASIALPRSREETRMARSNPGNTAKARATVRAAQETDADSKEDAQDIKTKGKGAGKTGKKKLVYKQAKQAGSSEATDV